MRIDMNLDEVEKWFLAVYDSHADKIFRHIYYKIGDRERAKEILQDTFMKAWQYIANGNEVENLKAFLRRTADNLIVDEYRKKKELHLDDLIEAGVQFAGGEKVEDVKNKIDAKIVVRMLDYLRPKYREVIVMRFLNDMTLVEIARLIGESENTVSVRINRAIKMLKKYINEK